MLVYVRILVVRCYGVAGPDGPDPGLQRGGGGDLAAARMAGPAVADDVGCHDGVVDAGGLDGKFNVRLG